jgi:hypothetical protein
MRAHQWEEHRPLRTEMSICTSKEREREKKSYKPLAHAASRRQRERVSQRLRKKMQAAVFVWTNPPAPPFKAHFHPNSSPFHRRR